MKEDDAQKYSQTHTHTEDNFDTNSRDAQAGNILARSQVVLHVALATMSQGTGIRAGGAPLVYAFTMDPLRRAFACTWCNNVTRVLEAYTAYASP